MGNAGQPTQYKQAVENSGNIYFWKSIKRARPGEIGQENQPSRDRMEDGNIFCMADSSRLTQISRRDQTL